VSLLVVGSVAYDALESPYGKVERTLGGAATYFSVSASFFTRVNLVGIVGDDFDPKDEAILKKRSIDIEGLERKEGKCSSGRPLFGKSQRARHTGHGPQRLRGIQTSPSGKNTVTLNSSFLPTSRLISNATFSIRSRARRNSSRWTR